MNILEQINEYDLYIQLLPMKGSWTGPGIEEKLLIADEAADFVTDCAIRNFIFSADVITIISIKLQNTMS